MKKPPITKRWLIAFPLAMGGIVWSVLIFRSLYWGAIPPEAQRHEFGWIFAAVLCLIFGVVALAGTIELSERSPEELSPDNAWPTAWMVAAPFLMGFVIFVVLAFVDIFR